VARGGQGAIAPGASGRERQKGGKNFFDGTSEGSDRGVARGQQLSYKWIS
jgi:hypothetical protein